MHSDVWVAIIQAFGTIAAAAILAVVGAIISNRYAREREETARRKEWIDQAIELTKLDIERKIHNSSLEDEREDERLRPPILDFLAYYRDLTELDEKDVTPAILYERVRTRRTSSRTQRSEQDLPDPEVQISSRVQKSASSST